MTKRVVLIEGTDSRGPNGDRSDLLPAGLNKPIDALGEGAIAVIEINPGRVGRVRPQVAKRHDRSTHTAAEGSETQGKFARPSLTEAAICSEKDCCCPRIMTAQHIIPLSSTPIESAPGNPPSTAISNLEGWRRRWAIQKHGRLPANLRWGSCD
jgi:hypothetical protein